MPQIEARLNVQPYLPGLGISIVGLEFEVILEDISMIKPESELLVMVHLTLLDQTGEIVFTQNRPYSLIQQGTPSVLPLDGALWIPDTDNERKLGSSRVDIYYIRA